MGASGEVFLSNHRVSSAANVNARDKFAVEVVMIAEQGRTR
jgi:hypothetical protein